MSPKPFKTMSVQSVYLSLIALTLGWMSSGCSMLGWNKERDAVRVIEDARHPVSEILCLWEPAEGHDMKGLPCRGFAAQILFFSVGNQAPAEVGGDVMIYVFDDHGTLEEQQKPLHQFSFPAESWQTYLRSTNFGATYQLFIPYTRPTSEAAICNLRVRYTSPEGRVTFSKIVEISLPGTPRLHPPQTATDARFEAESISQQSLLERLNSASPGAFAPRNSQVTQASYVESDRPYSSLSTDNASGSHLDVTSSRIEIPPTQVASHQMATLDHLLNSFEQTPAVPFAHREQASPAATGGTRPHLLSPVSPLDEQAAPVLVPTTGHRLHPLETQLDPTP